MQRLALVILRLYPRAWRDRYEAEVLDILGERGVGAADLLDLARSALDAWIHPQPMKSLTLATGGPGAAASVAAGPPPPITQVPYGVVPETSEGLITRRRFMRRMVGAGVGLLSLEFIGGTIAFLWPPPADGIGVEHRVGTLDEIRGLWPAWDDGRPFEFRPAKTFLVNLPAATAWASDVAPTETASTAADLLALWRKCPHLGCMVPAACDNGRFQCLCHQSTYSIVGEKMKLGPAARGMDRFPVRIDEDGMVVIDTREIIKGPPTGTITFHDARPYDAGCA